MTVALLPIVFGFTNALKAPMPLIVGQAFRRFGRPVAKLGKIVGVGSGRDECLLCRVIDRPNVNLGYGNRDTINLDINMHCLLHTLRVQGYFIAGNEHRNCMSVVFFGEKLFQRGHRPLLYNPYAIGSQFRNLTQIEGWQREAGLLGVTNAVLLQGQLIAKLKVPADHWRHAREFFFTCLASQPTPPTLGEAVRTRLQRIAELAPSQSAFAGFRSVA